VTNTCVWPVRKSVFVTLLFDFLTGHTHVFVTLLFDFLTGHAHVFVTLLFDFLTENQIVV
jgi:hypothetical protein